MEFSRFTMDPAEMELLASVVQTWCQVNHVEPDSECAKAAIATTLDLMEAGFRTHESLSIALLNALAPDALHNNGE